MNAVKLEKGEIDRAADEARGRFLRARTRAVNAAERTIEGVASVLELDRDGEIILPSAFAARLPAFLASSSPLMAQHTYRTEDGTPAQVGWVTAMTVEAAAIPFTARFAATDLAEQWWRLASDPRGKGTAFSIGFIPVRWVYGSVADLAEEFPEIRPAVGEAGLADEDRIRVYTEIELLEVSCVPVGANRGALQVLAAKAAAAATAGEAELDGLLDDLAGRLAQRIAAGLSLTLGVKGPPTSFSLSATEALLRTHINDRLDALEAHLAERFDEVKSLLPDDVNAIADAPGPGESDPADTPAAGDGPLARLEAALTELAAYLRGKTDDVPTRKD